MSQPLTERRYLCSELVSLLYEDRFRNTHEAMANLEEISSTTVTLLSEKKLGSGRPISLRAQGHDLYGVVESSVFDPLLGWYTKVKLDRLSRWHERLFVPAHFLALCASTLAGDPGVVTAGAPKAFSLRWSSAY
jgi:hypothetical protein